MLHHRNACRNLQASTVRRQGRPMTSTDFGKLIADETEKWGKVIRAANIKR